MLLKLYLMKCSEIKASQCILALTNTRTSVDGCLKLTKKIPARR